jgi:large subunit ribosomal protein L18
MNTKTQARQRRAKKSRVHMRTAGSVRLSVHRTPRHIYAQVISGDSKTVLAQASTLDKDLRSDATGQRCGCGGSRKAGCRACEGGWCHISGI